MTARLALTVSLGLASLTLACGQTRYPDIPLNHWIYADLGQLRNAGVFDKMVEVNGYFKIHAFYSGPPTLASDLAEIIVAGCKATVKLASKLQAGNDRPSIDRLLSVRKPVCELVAKFEREIRSSGEDPQELRQTVLSALSPLTPQFKDVPSDDWAAKQVLELRQLGIIQGYPDGTFQGL
jgi:hypothetical protein